MSWTKYQDIGPVDPIRGATLWYDNTRASDAIPISYGGIVYRRSVAHNVKIGLIKPEDPDPNNKYQAKLCIHFRKQIDQNFLNEFFTLLVCAANRWHKNGENSNIQTYVREELCKYFDEQDPLNLFIKEKSEIPEDKTDTRYRVETSVFLTNMHRGIEMSKLHQTMREALLERKWLPKDSKYIIAI